jgi:deferrochelatase/peroxidase EfeB
MKHLPPDAADVQGLVHSGYAKLTEASFLLLRIADPAAARAWLRAAPITSAADLARQVPTALHVAFSAGGLRALGLAEPILAGFSAEFLSGMAGAAERSRRLGDVGPNAPAHWDWGGDRPPDMLLALYAEPGALAGLRQAIASPAFAAGFAPIAELPTSDMGGHEPFGFADGISQPRFDFAGRRRPGTDADLEYGNLLTAGELLLGHGNEYGRITDRPLVDAAAPGASLLPPAPDHPGQHDFGRNGTYLVFRQLAQDVRGFWRFAAAQGDATAVAEAMVGRHLSGAKLLPASDRPIRGVGPAADDIARNNFIYDADPEARLCPFGAHVRRANPRTGDMPGGRQGLVAQAIRLLGFAGGGDLRDDVIASSRFHRILRRGREYGTRLTPQQAMGADAPDPQCGLHFICLNANIARQFEFIQNAWLVSAKFNGLTNEADPLLGNRLDFPAGHPTDNFARLSEVPRFITTRGGAYFFLPGLRTLRFLNE